MRQGRFQLRTNGGYIYSADNRADGNRIHVKRGYYRGFWEFRAECGGNFGYFLESTNLGPIV